MSDKLKDYRNKKLQKKVSADDQLAAIAKDVDLKKNLVDQLKRSDIEHSEHVKNLRSTMNQMTQYISSGFQLLGNIFNQQAMMSMETPMQPTQSHTQPSYSISINLNSKPLVLDSVIYLRHNKLMVLHSVIWNKIIKSIKSKIIMETINIILNLITFMLNMFQFPVLVNVMHRTIC